MGSGVQEEDSSSPNDSLEIKRAERTGTAGEIELHLSDGSFFFTSEQDLREENLSSLELTPGLRLSRAALRRLTDRARLRRARDKAVDLLARAPHSVYSLRLKLLKRGFEAPFVEQVLEFLGEKGYLDDRRFAESWLRERTRRRPEGRALLLAGLLRRGVGRKMAEEAVNRYLSPSLEREQALRALEKLRRSEEKDTIKLAKKLRARGFPYPLIRQVLEEQRPS
jgi:regulatory protein